jgi:hypothetical protein
MEIQVHVHTAKRLITECIDKKYTDFNWLARNFDKKNCQIFAKLGRPDLENLGWGLSWHLIYPVKFNTITIETPHRLVVTSRNDLQMLEEEDEVYSFNLSDYGTTWFMKYGV